VCNIHAYKEYNHDSINMTRLESNGNDSNYANRIDILLYNIYGNIRWAANHILCFALIFFLKLNWWNLIRLCTIWNA